MNFCFICGSSIDEEDKTLNLSNQWGDIYNFIHEKCYFLDDREFLKIERRF